MVIEAALQAACRNCRINWAFSPGWYESAPWAGPREALRQLASLPDARPAPRAGRTDDEPDNDPDSGLATPEPPAADPPPPKAP